jgi:hypothetical protein
VAVPCIYIDDAWNHLPPPHSYPLPLPQRHFIRCLVPADGSLAARSSLPPSTDPGYIQCQTSPPPSSSPITPRQDPASSPYTLEHHCYPSDSLSHLHVDLGAPRDSPADLLHLSRSIPPPPRSAESPRTTQSFPPRPSSVHRRQSSYLRKLELNAELERKVGPARNPYPSSRTVLTDNLSNSD